MRAHFKSIMIDEHLNTNHSVVFRVVSGSINLLNKTIMILGETKKDVCD